MYSLIPTLFFSLFILMNNENMGFMFLFCLTLLIILFFADFENLSILFLNKLWVLICLFFGLILTVLFLWFFMFFELVFYLVYLMIIFYCSSYYKISTSFFLMIFSLLGSLFFNVKLFMDCLMMMFWFCFLFLMIPFFIKIPSFPFYYWLPEVHCEVNTSMSLVLAGLLLKLGVYGMLGFILFVYALCVLVMYLVCVLVCYLFGLYNMFGWMFNLFNCKKMIGFFSILHLILLLVVLGLVAGFSLLSGIITSISHGYCSVGLFLVVGLLMNKVYLNYLDILLFINKFILVLFIVLLLSNLSFPGSCNFIGEMMSYICIIEMDCFFCLLVLFSFCLMSSFYWFLVLNSNLPFYVCFSMFSLFEYVICFKINFILWALFVMSLCQTNFKTMHVNNLCFIIVLG